MRLVLTLHSHLPWVLHHGRWPHGSDWLSEATLDTYLPLLAMLDRSERESIPVPITLGVTPILAAQLAHPSFVTEVDAYFAHRMETIAEAPQSLADAGDSELIPVVDFWCRHIDALHRLWRSIDGNILGEMRRHADAGRIELISSAATHGFLPLLARDESIRLQLLVGRAEHLRHFGELPSGCWVPECAYRPAGPWNPWPGAPAAPHRVGIEEHLRYASFRWFTVDAHLAEAGEAWQMYGGKVAWREEVTGERSPYRSYQVAPVRDRGRSVSVLVRDPRTTAQVWSRHGGYPGDGRYLEFHKIRYPGGLKLWRVTDANADLGAKLPYDPAGAAEATEQHARHFTTALRSVRDAAEPGDTVIVAPFDTELFGHWWFEGVEWLHSLYRLLDTPEMPRPATGSAHLADSPSEAAIAMQAGSWGKDGDFSMWLNEEVAWTWQRLWPLEERFWNAAPRALDHPVVIPVLEQAARELLLAQSSDWQFIISTGAAGDYATKRFNEHCDALESLLPVIEGGPADLDGALATALRLKQVDGPFENIAGAIAAASDLPPE